MFFPVWDHLVSNPRKFLVGPKSLEFEAVTLKYIFKENFVILPHLWILCVTTKFGKVHSQTLPNFQSIVSFFFYIPPFLSIWHVISNPDSFEHRCLSHWWNFQKMFKNIIHPNPVIGPPLVWVLWALQHPQFLKVWVLVPMVFGEICHKSFNFDKKRYGNTLYSILLAKIEVKHPQFEISNEGPVHIIWCVIFSVLVKVFHLDSLILTRDDH